MQAKPEKTHGGQCVTALQTPQAGLRLAVKMPAGGISQMTQEDPKQILQWY